jgi:hypothetical protein
MLDLQEAVERAELMAGEDHLLNQNSYDLLVGNIADEDVYPFTMALAERGVHVRTSAREKTSFVDKLLKSAQQFTRQSPGGIWLPSTMDEPPPDDVIELSDEDLEELDYDPFGNNLGAYDDYINSIRDSLEAAGIRVLPDGKVELYRSNIPGIYKDRLPQGPLPLDIAVKYYDQILDSTEKEQQGLDSLLDLLTQLASQTYEMEISLEDLAEYKFSPQSTSDTTRAISTGLEDVKSLIGAGDWTGAQNKLDSLRETIDTYNGERNSFYDNNLSIVDALDQLKDLKTSDPEAFKSIIMGLGGMPMAARKAYSEYDDEPTFDDYDELTFDFSHAYLDRLADDANMHEPSLHADRSDIENALSSWCNSNNYECSIIDSDLPIAEGHGVMRGESRGDVEIRPDYEHDFEHLGSDPDFFDWVSESISDFL